MTTDETPDRLDCQPLGALGARVHGVDLTALTVDGVRAVRQALITHRVLCFRDQHLTASEQVALALRFGEVTGAHPTVPGAPEDPRVLDLDPGTDTRTNVWHTDVTYVEEPPAVTILRAVDAPASGETLFGDTVAAYASLSPAVRDYLDRLDAVHTNDLDGVRGHVGVADRVFSTRHPVVRVHPETGERALLAGGSVRWIDGLSVRESALTLKLLHAQVTEPGNTVRVHWQAGDVVVWDNRSTQHCTVAGADDPARLLQRVTTRGTVPQGVDGRVRTAVLAGDASSYLEARSLALV